MRFLILFLTLLIVVGGGWIAFWLYAAHAGGEALDAWLADEAAQGRHWTCPDRRTEGFPFALAITCAKPSFAGHVFGASAVGRLASLDMRSSLVDPNRVVLTLGGPLVYRTEDGQADVSVGWSRMEVGLEGLPVAVTAATVHGDDVAVQGRLGTLGNQAARAATVDAAIRGVPQAPDPTVDFKIAADQVGLPAVNAWLGGDQPASLSLSGRLTQAALLDAPSPAALIDRWRQMGGSIVIAEAAIKRGPSQVEASGPLHLDPQHRVAGTLDARFTGAEPILKRYGINPGLAAAGAILNSLFGGRHGGPAPADGPNVIRLPIQFRDGRLGVGPVLTPLSLPPLY